VIIVGLGCVGMSTAYYLSKQGLKVLGIEQHHDMGVIGTGSFGASRIWRVNHGDERYKHMMNDAMKLWNEIE
jgi:sarcosine oxidase